VRCSHESRCYRFEIAKICAEENDTWRTDPIVSTVSPKLELEEIVQFQEVVEPETPVDGSQVIQPSQDLDEAVVISTSRHDGTPGFALVVAHRSFVRNKEFVQRIAQVIWFVRIFVPHRTFVCEFEVFRVFRVVVAIRCRSLVRFKFCPQVNVDIRVY
jgi:hypothetical protein